MMRNVSVSILSPAAHCYSSMSFLLLCFLMLLLTPDQAQALTGGSTNKFVTTGYGYVHSLEISADGSTIYFADPATRGVYSVSTTTATSTLIATLPLMTANYGPNAVRVDPSYPTQAIVTTNQLPSNYLNGGNRLFTYRVFFNGTYQQLPGYAPCESVAFVFHPNASLNLIYLACAGQLNPSTQIVYKYNIVTGSMTGLVSVASMNRAYGLNWDPTYTFLYSGDTNGLVKIDATTGVVTRIITRRTAWMNPWGIVVMNNYLLVADSDAQHLYRVNLNEANATTYQVDITSQTMYWSALVRHPLNTSVIYHFVDYSVKSWLHKLVLFDYCVLPAAPTNGGLGNCPTDTRLVNGSSCTMTCNTNYAAPLGSSLTYTCSGSTVLSPASQSSCVSVGTTSCTSFPASPLHGNAGNCTGTLAAGKICSMKCDLGYSSSSLDLQCISGSIAPSAAPVCAFLNVSGPTFTSAPSSFSIYTSNSSTSAAVVYFTALSVDFYARNVTVVCNTTSGSTLSIGTYAVQCVATDVFNQTSSITFTISVLGYGQWQYTGEVYCKGNNPACGATGVYSRDIICVDQQQVKVNDIQCKFATTLPPYSTAACTSYISTCVPSFTRVNSSMFPFPSSGLSRFGFCQLHSPGTDRYWLLLSGGISSEQNQAPRSGVYHYEFDAAASQFNMIQTERGYGPAVATFDHALQCGSNQEYANNIFTLGGLSASSNGQFSSLGLRQSCLVSHTCFVSASVSDASTAWKQVQHPPSVQARTAALHVTISDTFMFYIGGKSIAPDQSITYLNDCWSINFLYNNADASKPEYQEFALFHQTEAAAPFTPRYAMAGGFLKVFENRYGPNNNYRGRVLVIGGLGDNGVAFNDYHIMHLNVDGEGVWDSQSYTAPFAPRGRSAYTLDLESNSLYMSGGVDYSNQLIYNDVYQIDTSSSPLSMDGNVAIRFKAITQSQSIKFSPRFSHGIAVMSNLLFVFGGSNLSNQVNNDVYVASLPINNNASFINQLQSLTSKQTSINFQINNN